METQDIKNMGLAYFQVLEAMKKKKMDPVDADELKGDHADRDDKDIDNDGDADKSDEYLHNRRKAVKAAITKEEIEMDEAKKMSVSAKQIKHALASASAQAKPKSQVSLKKAPFDIPKESVEVERSWTILNRIQEKATAPAPRDMNHVKGATPPETMNSKASQSEKDFAATSGVPASVSLDANVVAQQTADAIRASAAKISGNSNRSNDQKIGDKNIIKSTVAESKGLTKLKAFLKLNK
jgi:hypothetical protein